MQLLKTVQEISSLPILQRISIIKNLLQTLKEDVFKQIENKQVDVTVFYQFFLLYNETKAVDSLLKQSFTKEISVSKGDKTLNPTELFGLWENNPRNLEDIRKKNWKRNWDL